VLPGRAIERDPRGPYAAVAEAFGRGLAGAPWLRDPSLVPLRPTLAHVVPEWSADARGAATVVAVAEAVLRLLEVGSRHERLMLAVEDMHWADPETLAMLAYLVDNTDIHRASCLLTSRSEPVGDALGTIRRLADTPCGIGARPAPPRSGGR
jgi:hypothetical protein